MLKYEYKLVNVYYDGDNLEAVLNEHGIQGYKLVGQENWNAGNLAYVLTMMREIKE